MKVRNGFVSNSSSSSFVAFVPEPLHLNVLDEIGEKHEQTLSDVIEVIEVVGINWYKLHTCNCHGECYYCGRDDDELGEAYDMYMSKLREIANVTKARYLSHEEDM